MSTQDPVLIRFVWYYGPFPFTTASIGFAITWEAKAIATRPCTLQSTGRSEYNPLPARPLTSPRQDLPRQGVKPALGIFEGFRRLQPSVEKHGKIWLKYVQI